MQGDINPYQPSTIPTDDSPSVPLNTDGAWDVAFRLTAADLRHAEAKHVLHSNIARLSLGSFGLIAASVVWIGWLATLGYFSVGWVTALFLSAACYLTLVHQFKIRLRERMQVVGLVNNAECWLGVSDTQFKLNTPNGPFAWPSKDVQVSRTIRGLLFSPEPQLFVFVSRKSNFQDETYSQFQLRVFTQLNHR
ncbi:hypothetical protein CA13_12560 [Planctomycetes bacterium CA13]|uniref:YcxB-like protein domain-containing protein n=1 Tax=Novipirellula herctigrandis TaxID=2527986 RepID=A0A5C5YXP8_9BACT|nr:hypothetical protein CA13_12560 [Planctomycetes bacterium CA13]